MRLFKQPRSPYYFFDARINGKRQRISTQEISRRAAERVAANYLLKIGAGDSVKRSRQIPTLQQFSERFFAWADNTSSLEPKTKKYYRYGWRLVSFTALAQTLIDQIDSEITDTLVFERPVIDRRTSKETGEWIVCGKTYSQQALRTLRVMLGQAHEWKILKQKPSFKIGKTPGRDGIITPEIEAVILRELNGYRTRRAWLAVLTVMDTGCRPSEVFAMRIENIDWAGRRIWIPEGKTAQARRWLVMTERLHKELSTWCRGGEGPSWLFPARTSGSKAGHLTSIGHSFKAACIRGGLDPKLVLYLTRHTFGTTAMRETGNTFAVMKAMGHSDVQSMRPYQHQELDQIAAVMNRRNTANQYAPRHGQGHTFGILEFSDPHRHWALVP